MTDLRKRILPSVQKPARYTGGEFNEIKKDLSQVRVRVAFCFPDTYEIGMSNLGMRILYGVMNRMEGVWCERVFAPWGDMEEAMRRNNLPLWALESQDPVKDFDMIAFTIGYEMCYTNILNMLNLAGVPLRASERKGLKNIVFAGGVCAYNPEPLADFADVILIGEGEEMNIEFYQVWADHLKRNHGKMNKKELLDEVVKIPGVYIPQFYDVSYDDATATVTVGDSASFVAGSNKLFIGNKEIELDVPAKLVNSRVYLPLRVLCEEVLGKKVYYNRGNGAGYQNPQGQGRRSRH